MFRLKKINIICARIFVCETSYALCYGYKHGCNLVGDTGNVPLHFFRRGGIICHVPPLFLVGFVFGEVSKLNLTIVTFCVKSFSCWMLHIAILMLKQSLVWYHITDSDISIIFYFKNDASF